MGHEGTCEGPGRIRLEARGLDFDEGFAFEEVSHLANDRGAEQKTFPGFFTGDEIQVTLTVLDLHILETVELLRQGAEAFSEKGVILDLEGFFSHTCGEHLACGTEEIADVDEVHVVLIALLAYVIDLHAKLELSAQILDRDEAEFPHPAYGGDSSGNTDPRGSISELAGLGQTMRSLVTFRVRVNPGSLQFLELFSTDQLLFGQILMIGLHGATLARRSPFS